MNSMADSSAGFAASKTPLQKPIAEKGLFRLS
jgi:hypothetical protein